MLTQIENTTHCLVENFLRHSMDINWERRYYELVRNIYCAKIERSTNYENKGELMDEAFVEADWIIKRLKEMKKIR